MANKRKVSGRKSFSAETKAEALRLIREENYTARQVATQIGCSIQAIQQWKAAAKKLAEPSVKPIKKTKRIKQRRGKGVAKTTGGIAPTVKPSISFDEFAQRYWSECAGASDILRLPPDITPTAIQYVNSVLRYAYDRFCE